MTQTPARRGWTRRKILKAAGWTAAGLTAIYVVGREIMPILPSSSGPEPEEGAAWIQIRPDGAVAMLCPRHELGQGASIGLAQIVAEELNVAAETIDMRFPSTLDIPAMRMTTGSQSLALYAEPAARAAAALREELRRRAAAALGRRPAEVRDAAGGFSAGDARLDYAALVGAAPLVLAPEDIGRPPLYSFDAARDKRQIGRCPAPVQTRAIILGAPVFAADLRLEGMCYGRAVPPPAPDARFAGAKLDAARRVPGVLRVVLEAADNFIGVIAETPGALGRGIAALETRWSGAPDVSTADVTRLVDVDAACAEGGLSFAIADDAVEAGGAWTVDHRVDLPIVGHAAQELRAAVVRFSRRDGAEAVDIWTGSQDTFVIQKKAAADLGWSRDRVAVHAMRVGGAFGGRCLYDVARDALRLGRAIDRPLKAMWSRADEFAADRHRPPSSHRVRIRARADGRIADWSHAAVSGHVLLTEILAPDWATSAANWVVADWGATRGLEPPYAARRRNIAFSDVKLPIFTGSWRSLGATPNTFAIETAMDALAFERGLDPVDCRLINLPPERARLAACLRRVRDRAEAAPLDGARSGRGYACGIYHEKSFVAAAADIVLDAAAEAIRVRRICVAQDVGLAVNPDQLRAQIEGCAMMAVSLALFEETRIEGGRVVEQGFGDYPTARMADAPEIEIDLISDPGMRPAGAGETALIAILPAIANAVRAASGRPVARLPIRYAQVGGARAL